MRLGRIGFDQVTGYLKDGMEAVDRRPDLVGRTDRMTATTLMEQLQTVEPPIVLDVRSESEWKTKHIDNSVNIPVDHLVDRIDEVSRDRQVVVHCATGYRSSLAASLLEQHGLHNVVDLVGGYGAWEKVQPEPVAKVGQR